MPEDRLNTQGRLYLSSIIGCGGLVVLYSVGQLWTSPVNYKWFVLAVLTLLSGSFTVRIPTISARLSVSETFVFATVLLFGPPAATLIVVLDTLVISLWLGPKSRKPARILFNIAAGSIAIFCASQVFYKLANIEPLSVTRQDEILKLIVPLFAGALCYFLLNSFLVAAAVAFQRKTTTFLVWRENFLWLSLNYISGASVAALLLPYLQATDSSFVKVLGVILPLLFISYLTFKFALGRVEDANTHLAELNRLYLSTIETLAMAIDAKDQITHGHIRRVQLYAVQLARAMGVNDRAQIGAIEAAALLHDMGKLAVPEYILNKPGPLTKPEFERMKLHASVGADILSAIDFPYPVVPIVRHHHENWDGTGYPDELSGTLIPIGARILSVVDCFDALTSDRPYRPRLSDKEALRILQERRGSMYDPIVVDTFTSIHAKLSHEVASKIPDESLRTIAAARERAISRSDATRDQLEQIAASKSETLGLLDLSQALHSARTMPEVSDTILHHLRRLVPTSLAALYRVDDNRQDLFVVSAVGDNATLLAGLRIPLGTHLSGWVAANKQSIRNSDALLDLGEAARDTVPRLRSCMATPIVHSGNIIGVLTLYSDKDQAFGEDHERILDGVAKRSAEAIATIGNVAVVVAPPSKSALVYISLQEEDEPARFDKAVEGLLERLRRSVRTYDSIERPHNYEVIAILRGPNATAVLAAATRLEITAKDYWAKTGEPSFRAIDVLSSPVSQSEGDLTLLRRARSRFGQDGARSDDGPESKIIH